MIWLFKLLRIKSWDEICCGKEPINRENRRAHERALKRKKSNQKKGK